MASENIGSLYPTKMPGYDDAADIQAALRLYHYGSEAYDPNNTNESQIPASSIAGHFKALDTRVDSIEATGVGSDYTPTAPSNPVDGFIWVDSDSSPTSFAGKQWVLHDSGTLSGTSLEIENLSGDSHYIIVKDATVSEASGAIAIKETVNETIVQAYTTSLSNSWSLSINRMIELANTTSAVKPFSDMSALEISEPISSYRIEIIQPTLADLGFSGVQEYQSAQDILNISSPTRGQKAILDNKVFTFGDEYYIPRTSGWTVLRGIEEYGAARFASVSDITQEVLNDVFWYMQPTIPQVSDLAAVTYDDAADRDATNMAPENNDFCVVLNTEPGTDLSDYLNPVSIQRYIVVTDNTQWSLFYSLPSTVLAEFSGGTYEVWSYR